jgi:hypothetical protein
MCLLPGLAWTFTSQSNDMAAPDVILSRPWILVTISSSQIGIYSGQAFGWEFGTVQKIFQTCDKVIVGDTILFEPDKGIKLVYGTTIYFMIEETNSAFTEVIPP